jgi:hypothetical protein
MSDNAFPPGPAGPGQQPNPYQRPDQPQQPPYGAQPGPQHNPYPAPQPNPYQQRPQPNQPYGGQQPGGSPYGQNPQGQPGQYGNPQPGSQPYGGQQPGGSPYGQNPEGQPSQYGGQQHSGPGPQYGQPPQGPGFGYAQQFESPKRRGRLIPIIAALAALMVAGAGGAFAYSRLAGGGPQPADVLPASTTASLPASTTTPTVTPTTTTVPPLSAKEVAWLTAVTRLHETMDKALLQPDSVQLTRAKMTSYANTLRACSRELARIGSPSDRLQPVAVIVKKACRTFDSGAKCWATAASVSMADGGVIAGTPEERTLARAIECGGAAAGNGSNLLSDAEAKGKEIKARFG